MSDTILISSDEVNVQLDNSGNIIVTQIGTPGERGPQGIQGPTGPAMMRWGGAYSGSTTYQHYIAGTQPGDVVTYNGETYFLYAAASAGTAPTNTSYWAKLAAKGDQGVAGPGNLTFKGAWSSGTSYSANDAVSYQGSLYAANVNVSSGGSAPDVNSDWQVVVQAGQAGASAEAWIKSVSTWEVGQWEARDAVRHEGSFYRCVSGHTSTSGNRQEPGTSGGASRWQLIAEKGSTGATGAAGQKGDTGTPGKNAVTWWGLHFPSISGSRRMVIPTACNLRLDLAVTHGTGSYQVRKNGTLANGQTTCAVGDRLELTASGVSGDYLVSIPITGA